MLNSMGSRTNPRSILGVPLGWWLTLIAAHAVYAAIYGVYIAADSIDYIAYSSNFFDFWRSQHVMRTPGYPAFLALMAGKLDIVIAVQHLMVFAMAWFVRDLLMTIDERAAQWAFWMIGLHPWFMLWANAVMTDLPAALFMVTLLWLLKNKQFAWAGVMLGVAILFRPASQGAVPGLLYGAYAISKQKRPAAIALLSCLLVLLPWLVRNWSNTGFVGVSSASGYSMWWRYTALIGGQGNPNVYAKAQIDKYGEIEGNRKLFDVGLQAVRQNPTGALNLSLRMAKAYFAYDAQYFMPSLEYEWTHPLRKNGWPVFELKLVFQYLLPLFMLLATIRGVWLHRAEPTMVTAAVLLAGLSLVVIVFAVPDTRLRIPSEPFMIMFAVLYVSSLLRKNEKSSQPDRTSAN